MNLFSKNTNLKREFKNDYNTMLKRTINFIVGCLLISLAYNIFMVPNSLVPGGVGGIAIILNKIFGLNYVSVIIVLNIILLINSFFLLGIEKTKKSILGTILFPLFISLTENINVWLQFDTSKVLLSAVFGGIIYGLGAGLVFRAGFTTGGTDIINQIISKYAKKSLGKSMLMSDGLIVLSSGLFFGINGMMYSILILYIISLISDRVVLGISNSKAFFIVTKKENEVKDYIINKLGHGVTIFNAKSGRKQIEKKVIMTILPTKDYFQLKEGIKEIDKDVFYIITDTYEVFGGE